MADTHAYPCADLHPVPDLHPVADTEGRSYVHAIPDLYTLAYIDTHTCSYCHGSTDADSDCYTNAGSANTTAWIDGYADACCYSYSCTDTDPAAVNADTSADSYSVAYPNAYNRTNANGYAYTDLCSQWWPALYHHCC